METLLLISWYLLPITCIVFVVKSVALAKQIKRGDQVTDINTIIVSITFTIIVCTIAGLILMGMSM